MTTLDRELRKALARRAPPAGFAEKILDRTRAAQAETHLRRRPRYVTAFSQRLIAPWPAVAAAFALVLATGALLMVVRRWDRPGGSDGTSRIARQEVSTAHGRVETTMPSLRQSPVATMVPRAGAKAIRVVSLRRRSRLRREEEIAGQQLQLALSIASEKLGDARRSLLEDQSGDGRTDRPQALP